MARHRDRDAVDPVWPWVKVGVTVAVFAVAARAVLWGVEALMAATRFVE